MSLAPRTLRFARRCWVLGIVLLAATPALATPPEDAIARGQDSAAPPRQLAEGVMRTVPAEVETGETFSRHDIVEILSQEPDYDWARSVRFDHDIWCLELSYKPIRFIRAVVPDADGQPQEKLIWYMVYRVRNPGDREVPFFPVFRLESENTGTAYVDRLIPGALAAIERRERPPEPLADSVAISGMLEPTPEGDDGVWGVATWEDVDPRTKAFSVFVGGLTNAYRWEDLEDGQRQFERKALELRFWRPGDEFNLDERAMRVGREDGVDYRWVYR